MPRYSELSQTRLRNLDGTSIEGCYVDQTNTVFVNPDLTRCQLIRLVKELAAAEQEHRALWLSARQPEVPMSYQGVPIVSNPSFEELDAADQRNLLRRSTYTTVGANYGAWTTVRE